MCPKKIVLTKKKCIRIVFIKLNNDLAKQLNQDYTPCWFEYYNVTINIRN